MKQNSYTKMRKQNIHQCYTFSGRKAVKQLDKNNRCHSNKMNKKNKSNNIPNNNIISNKQKYRKSSL